jgi:hypothetical protein
MIDKVLDFERDRRPGAWRQRLAILAGAPSFGPLVDRAVESLAMERFGRADPFWTGRAIYHNPSSRFCVPDADLNREATRCVEEGEVATVYLGHSGAGGLWAGGARYLNRDDWARLRIARGRGVFAAFGCFSCQLGGPGGEGYGVAAARNPQGPVAVIGSHGECFAAMCQLGADGTFAAFAGPTPERLGSVWLDLKKGIARGEINDVLYALLDAADGNPKVPQAEQRREHLEMFLLLGDPALRLPSVPRDLKLTAGEARPGAALAVRGVAPARLAAAKVRLTLERPLDSRPADLEELPDKAGPGRERVMRANHERANRFVVAEAEAAVRDGAFEARLTLPATCPWPRLVLRAYAANDVEEGVGLLPVEVKRDK